MRLSSGPQGRRCFVANPAYSVSRMTDERSGAWPQECRPQSSLGRSAGPRLAAVCGRHELCQPQTGSRADVCPPITREASSSPDLYSAYAWTNPSCLATSCAGCLACCFWPGAIFICLSSVLCEWWVPESCHSDMGVKGCVSPGALEQKPLWREWDSSCPGGCAGNRNERGPEPV